MMYHLTIVLSLMSLFPLHLPAHSNNIFVTNNTIAYPETGLFLDYLGLYTPSETIIHNSAIFPMTTATCHFLPLSAAENIPSCNVTTKRHKRLIDTIISLGVGAISLGVSVSNTLQIGNLYQQVALVAKSLAEFSHTMQIHGAHLAKIASKQIELTEELRQTQQAFNAMIPILHSHSEALHILKTGVERLQIQFQHSFLYLAITQIFRNELTLDFLSPDDLHKVVYDVIQRGNLAFNSHHGSLPIVQIITKLLVRQQIDFIPRSHYTTQNPEEIGRLVITNFFAVPQKKHTSFYTSFYKNETFQLTGIPRYWALNPSDNTTMEWHDSQESGCDLQLMTSCRDTPPIHTISKDTCFGQIIENLPLSRCGTISVLPSTFFLRSLRDNLWIISSPRSLYCLKIPKTEYPTVIQQTWNMNEQIILPPVALVNVTPGYTIACSGFTLVGRPVTSNLSSLTIFYNNSILTNNISIVNVYQYIMENTTWFKAKLIGQDENVIMNLRNKSTSAPNFHDSNHVQISSLGMLILSWMFFGVIAAMVFYIFLCKQRNSL